MTGGERGDLAWITARVRGLVRRHGDLPVRLTGQGPGTRPGSDIDLLVVGPASQLPQGRRGREVVAALAAFPTRFDVLYTEDELAEACDDPLSFASTAVADRRVLYAVPDGNDALTAELTDPVTQRCGKCDVS